MKQKKGFIYLLKLVSIHFHPDQILLSNLLVFPLVQICFFVLQTETSLKAVGKQHTSGSDPTGPFSFPPVHTGSKFAKFKLSRQHPPMVAYGWESGHSCIATMEFNVS